MRPPVDMKQPSIIKRVIKGGHGFVHNRTESLAHAIKLTFLHHLQMLYQYTLSVLKSQYIFTLIRRK